jgi:hypothetical protein
MRLCRISGCTNPYYVKQFCRAHYAQNLRGKNGAMSVISRCIVPGCECRTTEHVFCHMHHTRWLKALGLQRGNRSISGERNPRWNGGVSDYPNHSLMKRLRKEVLEEAGYICEKCGGVADRIHHRDNDKSHQEKSNYMPSCHGCNMSLHGGARQIRQPRAEWKERLKEFLGEYGKEGGEQVDKLLDLEAAGLILRKGERTVRDLCLKFARGEPGGLRSAKVGGTWRIKPEDLDEYVNGCYAGKAKQKRSKHNEKRTNV